MNEENEVREENSSDSQKDSSPPERSEAADKEVSEKDSENTISEKMDNNESSDSSAPEKPDTSDSSDTASAVDEIIDAIKKELDSRVETEADSADTDSEAAETGNKETDTEENYSEVTHTGKTRVKVYDPLDNEEDEEISVYTIASASDLPPYEATIVNRLDNILTCAIITACCALLILFHTLKRE